MTIPSMLDRRCWPVAFLLAVGSLIAAGAASAQVRIVAIGDSSVRGLGVDTDRTYPAQIERSLKKRGHNVVVTNAGINGDTCPGVAARLDSDVPNGTHIVLLSVGANDLFRSVPLATLGACVEQPDPAKCVSSAAPSALPAISACVRSLESRVRARGMAALSIGKALSLQTGTLHRVELHVVADRNKKGTNMYHLNGRGYAVVVEQTLPQVETGRASRQEAKVSGARGCTMSMVSEAGETDRRFAMRRSCAGPGSPDAARWWPGVPTAAPAWR